MRKLTMLTLVAVLLAVQSGCNRGWNRWMHRGDDCFETDGCAEGGVMMGGSTLLPPSYGPTTTTVLPGPVTTPAG